MGFHHEFLKAKVGGRGQRLGVTGEVDWLVLGQASEVFLSLINSVSDVILSGVFLSRAG